MIQHANRNAVNPSRHSPHRLESSVCIFLLLWLARYFQCACHFLRPLQRFVCAANYLPHFECSSLETIVLHFLVNIGSVFMHRAHYDTLSNQEHTGVHWLCPGTEGRWFEASREASHLISRVQMAPKAHVPGRAHGVGRALSMIRYGRPLYGNGTPWRETPDALFHPSSKR